MQKIKEKLGNFGRYQAFLFGLMFIPGFLGGAENMAFSWTGWSPDARCCVESMDGVNCDNNIPFANATANNNQYGNIQFVKGEEGSFCKYCTLNQSKCTDDNADHKSCGAGKIIYDEDKHNTNLIPDSLAIKFDLGCDRVFFKQILWMMFTLGIAISATFISILSDKYGRRLTVLVCGALLIVASFASIAPENYWAFLAFQVLLGTLNYGVYLTVYIVFMEFADGMPRTVCGVWYQGIFAVGLLWDGAWAYIFREWRLIQLMSGVLTLLLIPYYWIFPESVIWLVANNRKEEAKVIIRRAAKWNKVEISEELLEEDLSAEHHDQPKASVLDLFKHWRLAKNTLIVFFGWFAASMSYYGLAQNTSDLPAGPFVAFFLSTLSEMPGYAICVPMMEKLGRKPTMIILYGIGGGACILAGALDSVVPSMVIVAFALIGKCCVAAVFAVIYNYSAELFPTVVRQSGTGFASLFARIGSLSAPQIRLIGYFTWKDLPIVIYGIVAFIAGVLCFFLPETKGEPMPETIEDGINFGMHKHKVVPVENSELKSAEKEKEDCQKI